MSPIFGKEKKPLCERVGQDGEAIKYVCEVEPGKTFIVTVKPDGSISSEAGFVAPTKEDYEKIHKALIEKGERPRPPPPVV